MDYSTPEQTNLTNYTLDRQMTEKEAVKVILEYANVEKEKVEKILKNNTSLLTILNSPTKFFLTDEQKKSIKEIKFLIDLEGEVNYEIKGK